jgi:hypothetical protein
MSYMIFEMPDDPAKFVRWLERKIVEPNLLDLVNELEAAELDPINITFISTTQRIAQSIDPAVSHGATPQGMMNGYLGALLQDVLEKGLAALPRDKLRQLLKMPSTLIALQEAILLRGGEYWKSLQ